VSYPGDGAGGGGSSGHRRNSFEDGDNGIRLDDDTSPPTPGSLTNTPSTPLVTATGHALARADGGEQGRARGHAPVPVTATAPVPTICHQNKLLVRIGFYVCCVTCNLFHIINLYIAYQFEVDTVKYGRAEYVDLKCEFQINKTAWTSESRTMPNKEFNDVKTHVLWAMASVNLVVAVFVMPQKNNEASKVVKKWQSGQSMAHVCSREGQTCSSQQFLQVLAVSTAAPIPHLPNPVVT
jgi:hypothetical protein